MSYQFRPMNEEEARAVAAWRYEPPYDFYDMASDPEDLEELLDPEHRQNYYSALSGDALTGFFSFGEEAQVPGGDYSDGEAVDVGLGLSPNLVGNGLGMEFVLAGLEFARERFTASKFRLSVATFNERAIRVYERAGFRRAEVFTRGKDSQTFLMMVREA